MFLNKTVCGCVLLSLSVVSPAQTPMDSIRQLREVVITANSYKDVIPAQTLKGKELENLNSFSVADAIRYFSGVQMKELDDA
ncbi:hypothetical protein FACS189446_8660 [Bacteroidia bacterium]|nr:hypothetical protein FACS189446_8660 [Bacteroidia bacterium]